MTESIAGRHAVIMDRLLGLTACTLLTTGRTGTDFFQSLLDSHPQVLTFNGHLFFYRFWKNSSCVAAGSFSAEDLLLEFAGKNIEKFRSRYDIQERKDQLGSNYDQSLSLDIRKFIEEAALFLRGRELTSRNVLTAIYASYALCLGQDLGNKRLFFHHLHHAEMLSAYLADFPESKIVCMTRDPRANFVSGIEHWRKYNPVADQEAHLYYYIKRIFVDATVLKKYPNQYVSLKLEDLGQECVLRKIASWLDIDYDECMKKSTWGGLSWHGDRLSKKSSASGFSSAMLKNKWEERLGAADKYLFNFLMYRRLRHYSYPCHKPGLTPFIFAPLLILLPLKFERRYFSPLQIIKDVRNKEGKKIVNNIFCYCKRVILFFRYYYKNIIREPFSVNRLTCKEQETG